MRELLSDGSSRPPTCARASRRSSRSARRGSRVSEQLLIDRMLGGDRGALARLMTLVENRAPGLPALMSRLHPHTGRAHRSEEHTSELQSRLHLVCRLLLEKKKNNFLFKQRQEHIPDPLRD